MSWLTDKFRKKEVPAEVEPRLYPVHNWRGDLVCEAWKADTWSVAYLLWTEPRGEA